MASSNSAVEPVQVSRKDHIQQSRRRGRPRLESSLGSPDDVIAHRKERVRLAQRAYRNRRDTKVDGLKARVARLEQALEQTTHSFTRLQDLVSGDKDIPPRLALEISRTAVEIASAVQKTRSEELLHEVPSIHGHGRSRKLIHSEGAVAATDTDKDTVGIEVLSTEEERLLSTRATSNSFPNLAVVASIPSIDPSSTIALQQPNSEVESQEIPRGTWFTSLLLQLCSEQGMQLLTSPDTTFDDLHPALSIHLTWVTIDQLREQCLRARASNFEHMHEDPEQGIIFGSPRMYRSIEGSDGFVVPRAGKLEPQQLVHGRTRTRLGTDLRDFQGEWLEPIDVQEFLEDMGIFLEGSGQGGVLQIAIPEGNLRDIWSHDANAVFTEEIQRSRIMTSWSFVNERQDNELMIQRGGLIQVEERQASAFARHGHPFAARHQKQIAASDSFLHHQTLNNTSQFDLWPESNSPTTSENFINITLHLDRLMRLLVLAASCIGSGPGIRKEAIEHALRVSIVKH
ncbi:hypothetical protein DL98DRAFT_539046 [Cadophora sp. DSE1049]|nr:hypothetical protein DL98DRAFT_539046 [Cadophora sp. DSE1049]